MYMYHEPDAEQIKLRADLLTESLIAVRKLGKEVKWLTFAQRIRGTFGYRILRHKQKQWQILSKILEKVATRYPNYSKGHIADELSELVNADLTPI